MIYLWFTNTLYYDCNIQLTWSFFFFLCSLCVFSCVCMCSCSCLLAIKQQHSVWCPFFLLHKSRLNFYLMREQGDEKKRRRENHHHTIQAFSNGMILSIGCRKCMLMIDTNYTQMIHRKSNKTTLCKCNTREKKRILFKKVHFTFPFLDGFVVIVVAVAAVLFLICETNKWKTKW